jgi:hypothetical protein
MDARGNRLDDVRRSLLDGRHLVWTFVHTHSQEKGWVPLRYGFKRTYFGEREDVQPGTLGPLLTEAEILFVLQSGEFI